MDEIIIPSSVIEKGLDFLNKIIGPPATEVGLILADQVRFWRIKNQIRLLERAREYIERKGIQTHEIPLKILVPLLEKSSLEESEDLKDKWVGLLVNYVDSRNNYKSAIFPSILSQLSSNEAKFLEFMVKGNRTIKFDDIPDILKIYNAELSNLIRLGLIRRMPPKINISTVELPLDGWDRDITPFINYEKNDIRYQMTELGIEFLEACKLEK